MPIGPLLGASSTYAVLVAVPSAVAYGLMRNLAEARARRGARRRPRWSRGGRGARSEGTRPPEAG